MKKWEKVVKFNEKNVLFLSLDIKTEKLSSNAEVAYSLMLINLLGEYQNEDLDLIITQSLKEKPLGIFISGKNSRQGFDRLLSILSTKNNRKHIMTGFFDEKSFEENLELFLISSWPSEDRFDEWEYYSVLVVSPDINGQSKKLIGKIRGFHKRKI